MILQQDFLSTGLIIITVSRWQRMNPYQIFTRQLTFIQNLNQENKC
jgi:hypothetical protein